MFTTVDPGGLRSDAVTRVHRRAWSKSLIRVVAVVHDELISMESSLRETAIAPPHFGQCHSGVTACGSLTRWLDELMVRLGRKQGSCQGDALAAEAIGEQAEVADAHEASGKNVEEESAQELYGVQGHDTLLVPMGIVFPAEGNAFAVEADQAVVGDGDAMGVTPQVAQHLLRSSHGLLGINHPVLAMNGPHQLRKLFRLLKSCGGAAAVKQAFAIEAP